MMDSNNVWPNIGYRVLIHQSGEIYMSNFQKMVSGLFQAIRHPTPPVVPPQKV